MSDPRLIVRPATPADANAWVEMRHALWPEGTDAGHRDEVAQFFQGTFPRTPWAVLLAEDETGAVVGFAEVSIRPYAEGCVTTRVAYLEGWYVRPEARKQGMGRVLVAAAENWGRAHGCREFASDTQPDNTTSAATHLALGFTDVGLVRCFRKDL